VRPVAALGERLAARTLELVDIPSESRDEERLAAHVTEVLRAGGVVVRDLGDTCVLAGPAEAPVLLAGHLDTVPAQGNRPGRIEGGRVHGLGASDMKGALAVMLELVLAGAPYRCLFFGREELPSSDSALAPLLERDPLEAELVVMMEPTACELHAGCLGNIGATWAFLGRSGHSARPWLADSALEHAVHGLGQLFELEPRATVVGGLEFREVLSVTRLQAGIADNVIPGEAIATVNLRYPPDRTPAEAETFLATLVPDGATLEVVSNAAPGRVVADSPAVRALQAAGARAMQPKQAWTNVADFTERNLDAINFGPGHTALAHHPDEHVSIASLVRAYEVLTRFIARPIGEDAA